MSKDKDWDKKKRPEEKKPEKKPEPVKQPEKKPMFGFKKGPVVVVPPKQGERRDEKGGKDAKLTPRDAEILKIVNGELISKGALWCETKGPGMAVAYVARNASNTVPDEVEGKTADGLPFLVKIAIVETEEGEPV